MKKIIFLGTPDISTAALKTILSFKNSKLIAVISQPDRQTNRKNEIVYSPIKQMCLDNNIPLLQPEKIGTISEEIKNLNPDIMISCAYGQFITQKILDIPKIGFFNLHASLLPKLRGGAPIHHAIMNNFSETGITLMETILQMDAGDIISSKSCSIDKRETTKSLTEKLKVLINEVLIENWDSLINNTFIKTKQNIDEVSYAYNIKKEDAIINFNDTCLNIDCKIRSLFDKPMAIWNYKNQNIKIWEAHQTTIKSNTTPGTINQISKNGISISTNDYDILITKLQLPNKNPIEVNQLINGNHIFKEN